MKKLILSLSVIVCNFVFSDFDKSQTKKATELIQKGRLQVFKNRRFALREFYVLCKQNGFENLLEESFYYKNRKTTLKIESLTLLKFWQFWKDFPQGTFRLDLWEHVSIEIVQILLEEKFLAKPGIYQLFMYSVQKGRKDIVELLLPEIDCIDFIDDGGLTPLMWAVGDGHIEIVELLLKCGADLNAHTQNGGTALMIASEVGQFEIAKLLVERNAIVDAHAKDGATALIAAAQNGHTEIVKLLLAHKADINAQTKEGATALVIAAEKNRIEIVELLLKNGAKIDACTKDGTTALMVASEKGHTKVVELLLKYKAGIDVRTEDGSTALMRAAWLGCTDIVELLLNHGATVDICTKNEITALMFAAQNDCTDVVELLLKKGANVNFQTKDGSTALMLAVCAQRTDMIALLLERGADINACTKKGCTPFAFAVCTGCLDITELLLDRGAIIDICSEDGITALMRASYLGYTNIVELLLKKQEPATFINACAKDGSTALMFAALEGHIDIVRLLIASGARTDETFLPIDLNWAVSKDSVKVLLENGMPIQNIPSKFLDKGDDIIWQYIKVCLHTKVPEDKSTMEAKGKLLKIAEEFFDTYYSELPQEHREKILNVCCKNLTRKQQGTLKNLCKTLSTTTSVPTEKRITCSLLASLRIEFPLLEIGAVNQPTATQMKRAKRAVASANKAQKGAAITPAKDKGTIAASEIPFEDKLFDLTPRIASKVLDSKQVDEALHIIRACCEVLERFEISFELTNQTNHYLISAKHIDSKWGKIFYNGHTKPNKLTMVHGANKPCTDHYNAAISYLIHYICLLATNNPSAREDCLILLKECEEHLDIAKIRELYPEALPCDF